MMRSNKTKKGFVILYTVLISSIILAIALGISSISLGETILSSTAKEGNISFFAADAGVECALYHDRVKEDFDDEDINNWNKITCNNTSNITVGSITINADPGFRFDTGVNSCARVTVRKGIQIADGVLTRIISHGYNISCDNFIDSGFNKSRTIERVIQVTYFE